MKPLLNLVICFFLICTLTVCSKRDTALTSEKLQNQIDKLKSGDTLILKNGIYPNMILAVNNKGNKEKPIVIKAETSGKVVFTNVSTLQIGGEFIEISGILFADGNSGSKPVIRFKSSRGVANNCRLTNCVIDSYNPSDRFLGNVWVEMYGKNNRVDHCSFVGKLNSGVTLVVKLPGKDNQENFHSIDHNYFGARPRLGSNGGETMRVGTSTYSLTSSNTKIANNYFEHCNGEVEIISIKSSDNQIIGNTFYECEGVLTLRHGNRNRLEGNVFIGNNKPATGGIRVINAGHIIKNNHFQELKGERFWATLPIMNGVPNSAINRYHQVRDVNITGNVFVNCDNIVFGVGSDNERTANPENVLFADNTLYNPDSQVIFESRVNVDKVNFKNNRFATANKNFKHVGFSKTNALFTKNEQGLYASADYTPTIKATTDNTGADWFEKSKTTESAGRKLKVKDGKGLTGTIEQANNNDTVILTGTETYFIESPLSIKKHLTITGDKKLSTKPTIQYKANSGGKPLIVIENGGSLSVENVILNGASETGIAHAGITTQKRSMIYHYILKAKNVDFINYDVGNASAVFAFKSTYADTILFEGCTFSNISGVAINLASENEDRGKYNAENVIIRNSLFYNVMGSALKLYRGGNDESTLGPFLTIDQCTFHNIENRELGSALNLVGVQWISITNSIFSESGKSGRVIKLEDQSWIYCYIDHCNFHNTGRFESFYDDRLGKNKWYIDPKYTSIKNSDFSLKPGSALRNKSKSKGALGYLKST